MSDGQLGSEKSFRIVLEFKSTEHLENLLEFVGRSIDNGVLKSEFTWTAEAVESFHMEKPDGES